MSTETFMELAVLSVKPSALRCRDLATGEPVTFRNVRDEVPGEIITVRPSKVWNHGRTTCIVGEITAQRVGHQGRLCVANTDTGKPWKKVKEH